MPGGLYRILGVSRTASKDAIRSAYLSLAKQLHPDVNKEPEASNKFQQVRQAYEILTDDVQRREHDRVLDAREGGGMGPPEMSQTSRGPQTSRPSGFNQRSESYWHVYERARRAQEGTQAWHAQQRRTEAEFARAHGPYRDFDRAGYSNNLFIAFLRVTPLLLPLGFLVLMMSSYRRQQVPQSPHSFVTHDSFGRAFVRDAYGRPHRMPDFDR